MLVVDTRPIDVTRTMGIAISHGSMLTMIEH